MDTKQVSRCIYGKTLQDFSLGIAHFSVPETFDTVFVCNDWNILHNELPPLSSFLKLILCFINALINKLSYT